MDRIKWIFKMIQTKQLNELCTMAKEKKDETKTN